MKLAYFPGCSLHSTARDYDQSVKWVFGKLDLQLEEIPDWNCCGATSAHALDHELSVAVPARNLVLAEQMGAEDIFAPCAACYNRMKSAEVSMKADAALRDEINRSLPRPFAGTVGVKNLLELLSTDEMREKVQAQTVKPLAGMKIACYYGCLLVRPPKIVNFDDPEAPHSMDDLLAAAGAECIDWPHKTECCGASFALTRRDIVVKLVGDILSMAKRSGADAIATACPLCQTNLDTRQDMAGALRGESFNIPVYYVTELLAIAMGAKESDLGLGKHFVSCRS